LFLLPALALLLLGRYRNLAPATAAAPLLGEQPG
jgi:hypothetical protein